MVSFLLDKVQTSLGEVVVAEIQGVYISAANEQLRKDSVAYFIVHEFDSF